MYLILEPGLVEFLVVFGFCSLYLLSLRGKVNVCLLLAVGSTAGRVAWDLCVTRGYVNTEYARLYDPFLETSRSLWALLFLLLPLSFHRFTQKQVLNIGLGIFFLALSVTVFFDMWWQPAEARIGWREIGLVYNPSINPSIIVMTLPFTKKLTSGKSRLYLEALVLLVVVRSTKMTPILVYLAVQGVRAFQWNWEKTGAVLFIVPCVAVLLYFFRPTVIPGLDWNMHIPQRWEGYTFFIKAFHERFSWITGFGVNKFYSMGPTLQYLKLGQTEQLWFFAHSDFLELLLEQGLIGFATWGFIVLAVFYLAWEKCRIIFECAVGLATCMLFYFPLHTAMGTLVAVLCLSVLREENGKADT